MYFWEKCFCHQHFLLVLLSAEEMRKKHISVTLIFHSSDSNKQKPALSGWKHVRANILKPGNAQPKLLLRLNHQSAKFVINTNLRLRSAPLLVTLKLLSGSKWTFRAATTPIKTSASAFMLPGSIAALLIAWLTQNTLIRCLQGNHPVSCKSYANLVNEQIQIKIHKAASRQHMHWLAASACSSLSNIFFFFSKSAICLSDIYSFLVSSDLWVLSVYRICSRLLHRPLSDLLFRFNLLCSLFLDLPSLHPALSVPAPAHLSLSLSLWTPSPSPFVSGLSSVIDAAIYILWDARRKWKERCVCMFVWIVEGWWSLTSGPHLQKDRQICSCEVCVCVPSGFPYERPQIFPYIWSKRVIGPWVETFLPAAVCNVKSDS